MRNVSTIAHVKLVYKADMTDNKWRNEGYWNQYFKIDSSGVNNRRNMDEGYTTQ